MCVQGVPQVATGHKGASIRATAQEGQKQPHSQLKAVKEAYFIFALLLFSE